MLWYTQGELERARTGLNRVFELAHRRRHGYDRTGQSARVEHALGNLQAAREWFALAVDAFRSLGIPWGTGNALSGMASVALATADVGQAEDLLDEPTPVLRKAGPWFLTWALYVRAILAVRRGNADEAIGLVRESLTCIRDLQDTYAFAYTLVPLVAAAVLKGDERGRRGSWALGTPSASAQVRRWSSKWCTTSRCSRNERFVLALARIGAPERTQQGEVHRSMRC